VRVYRGPKPGPPESDLELHKKVDEIAESLVKLEGTIKQNTNSLEGLSTSIDNVKRDTEELYKDREIITNIREEVVALETKVNESIKKQTTIETNLKTDIRKIYDFINKAIERVDQARGELAERVKKLEEQPVPVDNKKVKILIKLRNFIIGWIVKGGE
jgi:DNA-binding ferritin-like protein